MLTITLYQPHPALKPAYHFHEALVDLFKKLPVELRVALPVDYKPSDIAVVHGWKKTRTMGTPYHRVPAIEGQQKRNKEIICVESGYVVNREKWRGLCWNGFNGLADWGYMAGQTFGPERRQAMGIELQPWRKQGSHILLVGQVPWDANVEFSGHAEWLVRKAHELFEKTDRPIIFRPHPKVVERQGPHVYADVVAKLPPRVKVVSEGTIWDAMKDCHAVVCWNSNSAVDATLNGVPAFTFHQNTMAWDVTHHGLEHIEDPPLPDREPWANALAYKQWSADEVRSGEAWEFIKAHLEKS